MVAQLVEQLAKVAIPDQVGRWFKPTLPHSNVDKNCGDCFLHSLLKANDKRLTVLGK